MPVSNSIGSFMDVKTVLDAALAAGGATYTLDTPAAAYRWRHRAYRFRILLGKLKAKEYEAMPGMIPTTPYDHMYLRIDGRSILIDFTKPEGVLVSRSGEAISLDQEAESDMLEKAAAEFAEELGIEP